MTLYALYRRAALTQQAHDRAHARMDAISLLFKRRVDTGRPYANWRFPARRILEVARRRRDLADQARDAARTAMYFDPWIELNVARGTAAAQRYAMIRKRELS